MQSASPLQQSRFSIPKMDCPSEENLIRMALDGLGEIQLSFDLSRRELTAVHRQAPDTLLSRLEPLKLGTVLLDSTTISSQSGAMADVTDGGEASTLWWLLAMNAAMFAVELIVGIYAESTGLIADSLDMFADAAVYGVALYAVGRAVHIKVRAARIAGWLQIILALMALTEVGRNFLFGSEPRSALMIGVSMLALAVNATCLVLLSHKRHNGVHMMASYIFSANDVIANLGVIVAGALVRWTGSPYPDLVIGTIIAAIVLNGARRILQLKSTT